MSFYVYRATLGAGGAGSRASGGLIGASGALDLGGASEVPGSFDPRGSSWSSLDEGALEAWPLRTGRPRPLTEVILIQMSWLTLCV